MTKFTIHVHFTYNFFPQISTKFRSETGIETKTRSGSNQNVWVQIWDGLGPIMEHFSLKEDEYDCVTGEKINQENSCKNENLSKQFWGTSLWIRGGHVLFNILQTTNVWNFLTFPTFFWLRMPLKYSKICFASSHTTFGSHSTKAGFYKKKIE